MPKVTEEYIEQVKLKIINAARAVCREKPAYEVTMRDVIRQANLSPGAVYSYYKDIDDLWIDYINRVMANEISAKSTEQKSENMSISERIDKTFEQIGIAMKSIAVVEMKILFELDSKRITNPQFAEKRRKRVKAVERYNKMLTDTLKYIKSATESGKIKPFMEAGEILNFIQVAFDGIMRDVTLERCYGLKKNEPLNEISLMTALAKSVKVLLNIDNN